MTGAVKIPVTVKMRAGWNDGERSVDAREDGRGRGRLRRRRPAARRQSYSGLADWDLVAQIADQPPSGFGSGGSQAGQVLDRLRTGVTACSSAAACCGTRGFSRSRRISSRRAPRGSRSKIAAGFFRYRSADG
jgi:tRNA-dihydrouridine synthase